MEKIIFDGGDSKSSGNDSIAIKRRLKEIEDKGKNIDTSKLIKKKILF